MLKQGFEQHERIGDALPCFAGGVIRHVAERSTELAAQFTCLEAQADKGRKAPARRQGLRERPSLRHHLTREADFISENSIADETLAVFERDTWRVPGMATTGAIVFNALLIFGFATSYSRNSGYLADVDGALKTYSTESSLSLAPNPAVMIATRLVQGVGAALLDGAACVNQRLVGLEEVCALAVGSGRLWAAGVSHSTMSLLPLQSLSRLVLGSLLAILAWETWLAGRIRQGTLQPAYSSL